MKQYAYYPGCSLESLAVGYNSSSVASAKALDVDLKELDDWNCCGATAYFHVDEILAHTLVARNLAIAEKEGLDFVAPCSGCYKNAYFTNQHLQEDQDLADHINYALEADDLQLEGTSKVKHLIEVFTEDVGLEEVKRKVKTPLRKLNVAPYYGCQLVRPNKNGGPIEDPQLFEELISALGATPTDFSSKTRCCGGSLIITNRPASINMVYVLLKDAVEHGADVIATLCPMCNINLEVYQRQVNREYGTNFSVPVMYFTQIIGLALGIRPNQLGIGKEMVSLSRDLFQYSDEEVTSPS